MLFVQIWMVIIPARKNWPEQRPQMQNNFDSKPSTVGILFLSLLVHEVSLLVHEVMIPVATNMLN